MIWGGACRHRLTTATGEINEQEVNAKLVQVAWDALVVIINPANKVDSITIDQLKKIYNGEITKWSELGGINKPIGVIARQGKNSGVGHMFRRIVFNDPELTYKSRTLRVKSSGPLEKKVEKMSTAIGVTGISSAKRRKVKFLSLNGIAPTKENIATGKYTLFRPLYLVVNKQSTSEEALAFIKYALSKEGQAIISQQGTVNMEEGHALKALWAAKKESLGL